MESNALKKARLFINDIKYCVENFNIDSTLYTAFKPSDIGVKGDESNTIYVADGKLPEKLIIAFGEKAKDSKIFIGKNVKCRGSRIVITHGESLCYIGNNSQLNNVTMHIWCKWDFVVVGEGVSVTSTSNWTTGINPGNPCNGIIIGDHCLMSQEISIRPADGHQIIELTTRKVVNAATSPIIIEPYCWIGQRTAMLKNVRIGACSIVSLGAVVTKSCKKFSALSGVPAKARCIEGKMWLRNNGEEAKRIMLMYEKRFAGTAAQRNNYNNGRNERPLHIIYYNINILDLLFSFLVSPYINIYYSLLNIFSPSRYLRRSSILSQRLR
ncbi:acyltransferase [Escherichia coli]|nr:acyltransferase [Escherichia coli]